MSDLSHLQVLLLVLLAFGTTSLFYLLPYGKRYALLVQQVKHWKQTLGERDPRIPKPEYLGFFVAGGSGGGLLGFIIAAFLNSMMMLVVISAPPESNALKTLSCVAIGLLVFEYTAIIEMFRSRLAKSVGSLELAVRRDRAQIYEGQVHCLTNLIGVRIGVTMRDADNKETKFYIPRPRTAILGEYDYGLSAPVLGMWLRVFHLPAETEYGFQLVDFVPLPPEPKQTVMEVHYLADVLQPNPGEAS